MYNVALLVAGITGAILVDVIIRAYVKKLKEVLGEIAVAVLLGVIAWLLTLEGVAKTYLQDSFIFWCALLIVLAVVIVMIWVHILDLISHDERRYNHKQHQHGNSHSTPANSKKGSK